MDDILFPRLILKPNRDKPVLNRHPWIFSGAVSAIEGSPSIGETIRVDNSDGKFLCWAAFSPQSQIAARIWSWDEDERIDDSFFYRKIDRAISLRDSIISGTDAVRLVYAESDGIPGFILDRYKDILVIQLLSAGAEYWRESIIPVCSELLGIPDIYERSDVDVRSLEGLGERIGVLTGDIPSDPVIIYENNTLYYVDILQGHKTGFYLDQRENRRFVTQIVTGGDLLDCFSYTGGFSIPALRYGANSVVCIETSGDAIELAKKNLVLNNLPADNIEFIEGDVFHELRLMRDRDLSFDLIILDPPKFAPNQASVPRASRGYKDINLLALKLLRSGGYLITFSCSGAITEALFQKIISDAALDAKTEALIVDRLNQAPDHPVALNFPEAAYLKGLVIKKIM